MVRWSTTSVAASNRPSTATAATRTTRSTASATLLRCAQERLTDRQHDRLTTAIDTDERHVEVMGAYRCAQQLRQVYHQPDPAAGRRLASRSSLAS